MLTTKSFVKTLEKSKVMPESTVQSGKRDFKIFSEIIHRSSLFKKNRASKNYKDIVPFEKYVRKGLISKQSTAMFLLNEIDTNEINRRSKKF